MAPAQSYESHTHHPKMTYAGVLFWLIAVVSIIAGWVGYDTTHLGHVFLSLAVLVTLATSRAYTTALQNRIIRLELRVRAEKRVPPDLFARFDELRMGQIVALRFASDTELPALMKRALDESLSRDAIKKAVSNWERDPFRT